MEWFDFLKYIGIPLAVLITGHQYKVLSELRKGLSDRVTEERVRSIIHDKAEALHLADNNSQERLDRLEDRMSKIDDKLDKIMEILRSLK